MYKLLLMTADGEDYVTEGEDLSMEDTLTLSEDIGSRWIFYPLHFIIKDHGQVSHTQRIIVAGDNLDWAENKSLKTVTNLLKESPLEFI